MAPHMKQTCIPSELTLRLMQTADADTLSELTHRLFQIDIISEQTNSLMQTCTLSEQTHELMQTDTD